MSNSTPDAKPDLIDRKEFRKRRKESNRDCEEFYDKIIKITSEKEISFGTIIERNAEQFADNVAI